MIRRVVEAIEPPASGDLDALRGHADGTVGGAALRAYAAAYRDAILAAVQP